MRVAEQLGVALPTEAHTTQHKKLLIKPRSHNKEQLPDFEMNHHPKPFSLPLALLFFSQHHILNFPRVGIPR